MPYARLFYMEVIMLYKIGTEKELSIVENKLPYAVFKELFKSTVLLDYAYSPARNSNEVGGFSLIAENADDFFYSFRG